MLKKGKVSKEIIDALKAEHNCPLFKWSDPQNKNDEAVFKQIDHELLRQIRTLAAEAQSNNLPLPIKEVNDLIFSKCVLWPQLGPEELDDLVVGAIPAVVKSIQLTSGLIDVDAFGRPIGNDINVSFIKDFEYWDDISDSERKELKETTPFQLYRVRYGRWFFVIRPITRTDLRLVLGSNDESFTLANLVCVWPKEVPWDLVPSGAIDALAEAANKVSGYMNEPEIEEL